MKTNIITTTFCAVLFATNLFSQGLDSNVSIEFNIGMNNSDINYGNEFLRALLPKEDYLLFQSEGDSNYGYFVGIGTSSKLTSYLTSFFHTDFNLWQYKIDGSVGNLKPDIFRSFGSEIPTSAAGNLKYAFLSLQLGLRYHLGKDLNKGLFISGLCSYKIHLQTNSTLDLTYEDGSTGIDRNNALLKETNYNNLWMLGLELGYNFPLKNQLVIAPKVDFQLGLNGIIDDNLSPALLNVGVSIKKWL